MTVTEQADDIRDTFAFLDDWETRYEHIIDLGKTLPPMEEADQNEANRVRGCASQVWIKPLDGDDPKSVYFQAQSDAILVSGLIALLTQLFHAQPAQDILDFDAPAFFSEIGLDEALSAQRANGLKSMLERIRLIASNKV
tara:strand:- start:356 stop:775 length:420 start_codon:yes stop_codon:yes gene_type:complete